MRKIHKGFALAAVATAVLMGCQTTTSNTAQVAEPTSLVVSPSDKRAYDTIQLENGIEVVLVSDPGAEKSAAALSVGVGLLHDPMEHQGMAHYLEHMLFLGTKRFPDSNEYSEFMTANGGAHNAYTWLDITNYMFKVNADAYDEALDRFSDFFKAPLLTAEYVDKERSAVNAEWSMRREMDFFTTYKLDRGMMGEHPANRFLIGNLETLADSPNSKLHGATVDFFNKYYSSNIMKVSMISNQPLDKMRALAQKHFSGIKNKQIEKPSVTAKMDFNKLGSKLVNYVPNEDSKQLQLAFTIENNSQDFRVKPNHFISYLLGSEMPGTPASLLKEKGWVSSFSSNQSPAHYGNYGTFNITAELTDEGLKHRNEITGLVLNYLELIREKGIDEKYFNEIKISLANKFRFLEKQDEFGYVSNLTQSMQDYPLYHAIDAGYRYDQFDADAIHAVLKQLTPETLRVWHISKAEDTDSELHFYDGKYKISDLSAQDFANWQQQARGFDINLPAVNTLLPESFELKTAKTPGVDKPVKLYNQDGIQIWHQPSQYFTEQPKGAMQIYLNTALSYDDVKSAVLLKLWSDIFALQHSALATEAQIAGMSMGVTSGNGLVVDISGFTDKQGLLLEKAMNGLSIQLDEQGFAQAIDRYTRGIANSEKGFPLRQIFPAMQKLVRHNRWSNQTLIDTAKGLTLNDLQGFIQHTLKNNHLRVLMFGNYDQNDVQAIASQLKSSLPERKSTSYARSKIWKPVAGDRLVMQKDIPVADLGMLDLAVLSDSSINKQAQANILSRHLRTQAFDTLRTEEQLAYGVGAFSTKIKDHAAIGFYIQTPVKNPVDMLKRFDDFKSEYQVKLDALTQEEFDKIKASTLMTLKEKPKNLSDELGRLVGDWYDENWDFDTRDKLIAATEKVTLADIKAVYKEAFFNQQTPRVVIQLRGAKFKDSPFAKVKGQTLVEDLAHFHREMQVQ